MRKLIAGLKVSVDGKTTGAEGYADWVDAWSEDYGLTPRIDACLLGGRMYPGYEQYWTAIQQHPTEPLPMTGKLATEGELAWARFAKETPHYVLSKSVTSAQWSKTRFLESTEAVSALKKESGKDIYLMGGATIAGALMEAGLVDELRLIVYPIIAGPGQSLFEAVTRRCGLKLQSVEQREGGQVGLVYAV